MGLNRFYTFNGSIIKTAAGNPIGYEQLAYPTDSLYGRWDFDSDLVDSVNGHDFTASGSTSYGTGPSGFSSIDCDTNAYLYSDDADWANVVGVDKDWSISFWSKGATTGKDFVGLGKAASTTKILGVNIWYGAGLEFRIGSSEWTQAGYTDMASNVWQHFVFTCDGTGNSFKLYQNNSLKGSKAFTDQWDAGDTFRLNWSNYASKDPGARNYALAYVYTKVLDTDEIEQLYTEGGGS